MAVGLFYHERKAEISCSDFASMIQSGFSGAPVAKRHWALSKLPGFNSWFHKTIAIAEYCPLLGGIIALIESLVYKILEAFVVKPLDCSSVKFYKSPSHAIEDMYHKGVTTIKRNYSGAIKSLLHPGNAIGFIYPPQHPPQISATLSSYASLLNEHYQESIHLNFSSGIVIGMFEGHKQQGIAHFVKKRFSELFPSYYIRLQQNVYHAFKYVFYLIQQELKTTYKNEFQGGFCEVSVSFLEKKTGFIYTATIGNSQIMLYRKWGAVYKVIPLSYIRDPASAGYTESDDETDSDLEEKKAECEPNYIKVLEQRQSRRPSTKGAFVTCALGNIEGLLSSTKITINKVRQDDVIVAYSTMAKSCLGEEIAARVVANSQETKKIAQELAHEAQKMIPNNTTELAIASAFINRSDL